MEERISREKMDVLKKVIPAQQLLIMLEYTKGEDGIFYIDILNKIVDVYNSIPELYATDGNQKHTNYLHYFVGGSDFYFAELDKKTGEGFGYACLNGDTDNAEWGYLDLSSTLAIPYIELDIYNCRNKFIEDIIK